MSTSPAVRFYLGSSAMILTATGVLKLSTSFTDATALDVANPVFQFLSNRHLLMLVSLIELVAAISMLTVTGVDVASRILLAISTVFIMYRAMLFVSGVDESCFCLGIQTGLLKRWSGLDKQLSLGMLLYMLAGSTALLWMSEHRRSAEAPNAR